MRHRYAIPVLAAALCLGLAAPSHATLWGYSATLTGTQEVPANASTAYGTATLVYDDVANTLTTTVNFCGLTATATAAHIHAPAPVGVNASVMHGFTVASTTCGVINDYWTTITPTQKGYLDNCTAYVNVHNSVFPGGEIRGQICPDSAVPTHNSSWGRLKVHYR